jgi:hypothetical protein
MRESEEEEQVRGDEFSDEDEEDFELTDDEDYLTRH